MVKKFLEIMWNFSKEILDNNKNEKKWLQSTSQSCEILKNEENFKDRFSKNK